MSGKYMMLDAFDFVKDIEVFFAFPNNGTNYDIENAKKHLKEGQKYKVSAVDIHASSTEVYLDGLRNVEFNSVQFGVPKTLINILKYRSPYGRFIRKIRWNSWYTWRFYRR
jgi:hypothetical protein